MQNKKKSESGYFKSILDAIPTPIYIVDDDLRILDSNNAGMDFLPRKPGLVIKDRCGDLFQCCHSQEDQGGCGKSKECKKCVIRNSVEESYEGKKIIRKKAKMKVISNKRGQVKSILVTTAPFIYQENQMVLLTLEDISELTERKAAEQKLRKSQKDLEKKTKHLEEVNTALNVLLEKRDKDKSKIQNDIMLNLKNLAFPYLEKLKCSDLGVMQKSYVNILESNLKDVISPFYKKLVSQYSDLTPREIQIADLIRQGNTSKEIAQLLRTSQRAVEFHRNNIRKKFGILHKKTNLRNYLIKMT
jgi:DNA-binding CsgD family transcriptional regulator